MPQDSLELFPKQAEARSRFAPLAERMRPSELSDVIGQEHLVGPDAPLRALLASDDLPSLILWGPPGSGKTTLAHLIAHACGARLEALSAVLGGVKEVRASVERARQDERAGQRTVLFVDEIHRFNRAQQDALLPHVERGTVTLIGATTENPSFEVTAPLLSRCRVLTLKELAPEQLVQMLERALQDPSRGLGKSGVSATQDVLAAIAMAADGDARRALGILEDSVALRQRTPGPLELGDVRNATGKRTLRYDRDREEHYNVISAFIKSLRASDPDAALYYLARMLEGGEDPLFIARRLVIFSAEDVGNADPQALTLATSTFLALERIGMPEGRIPLGEATTYLACAHKSNAAYLGIQRAGEAVREQGTLPVPKHLRNAPTKLMKDLGYGRGYRYPHSEEDGFVPDANLPKELEGSRFYEPSDSGAEKEISQRLAKWRRLRDDGER